VNKETDVNSYLFSKRDLQYEHFFDL